MPRGENTKKGKPGFQPTYDSAASSPGATQIPSPAPNVSTLARNRSPEPDTGSNIDNAYDTFLNKTQAAETGTVDTRRHGTYIPTSGPIDHWQASEGLTIQWERNPLVPGRDTARIELDIPELSGRHDDVRALLRDNQAGEALRSVADRLRAIADDMEHRSLELDFPDID